MTRNHGGEVCNFAKYEKRKLRRHLLILKKADGAIKQAYHACASHYATVEATASRT